MEQLSNRLRVLRAERDETQEDLARAVGVTRQTILAIEKGDYVPSLLLGMKIARHFGRTVEEVFSLEGKGKKALSA